MNVVIISDDINTTKTPTYKTIALKYNLFDIQHINDIITCEASLKLEGCYDENDTILNVENLPSSYQAQMKAGHTLNWIADQDGNVDEKCVRAFINKITINESFSYIECMENRINFNYILEELLLSTTFATNINPIANTIYSIGSGVVSNISSIYNDKLYKTMDISSGVMNYRKLRKQELFQFDSLPLYDNQQFLESFNLECKKEGNSFSMHLTAKVMTVDIILQKITGNTEPVDLSATCG